MKGGEYRQTMNLKKILKNLKLSEQNISMILGALVIVAIGILIFNYFQGSAKQGTITTPLQQKSTDQLKLIEDNGKMVPEGLPTTVKVEKGQDLWKIAEKYYGSGYNWVDIAKENKLVNPNRLSVGQELIIPKVEVRKPLNGKATTIKPEQPSVNSQAIIGNSYTVVKGDNLWTISVRAYQDGYKWVEVARANKLANPNIIHVGTVLTLPR